MWWSKAPGAITKPGEFRAGRFGQTDFEKAHRKSGPDNDGYVADSFG